MASASPRCLAALAWLAVKKSRSPARQAASKRPVRPGSAPLPSRKALMAAEGMTPADVLRLRELEKENADLRKRVAEASARTKTMLERMRFLRQQQERKASGSKR